MFCGMTHTTAFFRSFYCKSSPIVSSESCQSTCMNLRLAFFFGARIIALDRCSIYFRIIHKYSWHPFSSPRNWSKRYPTVTTQDACPPAWPSWRSVRSWFFKDLYLSSLPKKLLNKKSYGMVNCGRFSPPRFCSLLLQVFPGVLFIPIGLNSFGKFRGDNCGVQEKQLRAHNFQFVTQNCSEEHGTISFSLDSIIFLFGRKFDGPLRTKTDHPSYIHECHFGLKKPSNTPQMTFWVRFCDRQGGQLYWRTVCIKLELEFLLDCWLPTAPPCTHSSKFWCPKQNTAVRRAQAECEATYNQFVDLGESVNITMCLGWLVNFFWEFVAKIWWKFLAWNWR